MRSRRTAGADKRRRGRCRDGGHGAEGAGMAGQGRRRGGQAVERRARYEPTEGCLVPIGLCNLWATVCQRNVCFLVILRRRVCVISQCGIALPVRTGVQLVRFFISARLFQTQPRRSLSRRATRGTRHTDTPAYALRTIRALAYTLQRYAAMHARSLSDAPYHPISCRSSRAVRSDPQKLGTGQPLLWTHATHPNQR